MKQLIALSLMMILYGHLSSQPNLTSANSPAAGDIFASLPLDTASVQPGTPGANKTWDFSSLVFIYNPIWDNYITASSTPYFSAFPNANIASFTNLVSGEYYYHKTSSTAWEIHGYANNLYEFPYSNIHQIITYPFTYNSVLNDTYGGTTSHSGLTIVRTGTYYKKGIAYGGLILPTGNFSNILLNETLDDYTDVMSGGATQSTRYKTIEYSWNSPAYKFPLLYKRIVEIYVDGTLQSTLALAQVSTAVSGIGSTSDDGRIAVYPQPATDQLNIGFHEIPKGELLIECYSVSGQKISRLFHGRPDSGQSVFTFDVSGMKAGIYLIKIQSENGSITRKFIIR